MSEISYDTSSNSLLDHSIEKWKFFSEISYELFSKRIVSLDMQKTCSLCYAYIEDDCYDCPVTEIACEDYCLNTPVQEIFTLLKNYENDRLCIPTIDAYSRFKELALKEVIFLQRVKKNASEKRVWGAKTLIEIADEHLAAWKVELK